MQTLALVQGDLVLLSGSYLTYSGFDKIRQDITLALQEEYQGDSLHPRWGSILGSFVGKPLTADVKASVLSEVNRVINNYITVQNAQIAAAANSGVQSVMNTDEVVDSIESLNAVQVGDSLIVTIELLTLSQQSLSISQVLS